jgi:hypothetical protein
VAPRWRYAQTPGTPAVVRDCKRMVAVSVDDVPTRDLASALTPLDDRFAWGRYAESRLAGVLGQTLELLSGSPDFRFGRTRKEVEEKIRTATVKGDLVIADGRREPQLFGGIGRLQHDFERFRRFGHTPPQLSRLLELEEAGIDAVELPSNPPVDNRFAGLNFEQFFVVSMPHIRQAEKAGRIEVVWSP